MYKQLSPKQRKFLEYLQDEYKYLGYNSTIPDTLNRNAYDADMMEEICNDWHMLLAGKYDEMRYYDVVYNTVYKKIPTKYLK